MKRLGALNAGAAAAAMPLAALVAAPGQFIGHAKPRALGHDAGLVGVDERCVKLDLPHALQSAILHGAEGVDEGRTAIGIDEVIAAMHRDADGVSPGAGA